MAYRILVGSYTNEVFTLEFDSKSCSISILTTSTAGFHPSWSDGGIIALKYDDAGKGTVVASAPSGGQDPCHLLVKDDELFIANYSSGDFAILPISREPPYIHSQTPVITHLTGSGPNKERQLSAHAHGAYWSEETKEILVPDLGGDFVYRFRKDGGAWNMAGKIKFEPGGGPRHIALHDGVLYTLLELKSSVVKHTFPSLPQEPMFLAASSTLLHPPALTNEMLAAEILIPPPNSADKTAYVYPSRKT
ncbi:hypothetical protein MPER_07344, partial [Moniliophthora perniciosa FA553]